MCFKILLEILSHLRGLTLKLQMQAADIIYAYEEVSNIVQVLIRMREESESEFCAIFSETTKLGKEFELNQWEADTP